MREIILDGFDMSLGTGLGSMKGKIFRIGHLGHFNDLMLCGTLCGVEMGLHRAGIPHRAGGVAAALEYLGAPEHRMRRTIDDPGQRRGAARPLAVPARPADRRLPAGGRPAMRKRFLRRSRTPCLHRLGEQVGG